MPYVAHNAIPVISSWDSRAVFKWPFGDDPPTKLDVFVNSTDIVVQVVEDATGAFVEDVTQEVLLRQGFNSRVFLTPFFSWRFKVWPATLLASSGSIDFAVYS